MTDEKMIKVRNKTGESFYIATVGEEGFPVHAEIGDDELTPPLPEHLAERLAEQPGWELDGRTKTASTTKGAGTKSDGE